MQAKNFKAQVDDIVLKNEKRMNALVRQSVQELIDQAQTPVGKGGKMRVDTGFLRASGQLSFTGMPTGPVRPEDGKKYPYETTPYVVQLSKSQVGTPIFFGWTAEYAKFREVYDGFLGSAVQNWQSIVDKVVSDIKRRIS
jgi:hypothetical protein